jgi:hypothetical protein
MSQSTRSRHLLCALATNTLPRSWRLSRLFNSQPVSTMPQRSPGGRSTFYGGAEHGYTDYNSLDAAGSRTVMVSQNFQ